MTLSSTEIQHKLELFEFAPGRKASWSTLENLLPDVQTALFFAKAFELDFRRLSDLVFTLFKTPLMEALSEGSHSTELQDYIVDVVSPAQWMQIADHFVPDVPVGEFLPE